ncbi:hypothetical protein ACMGD3_24210 [Lysinibacillus sphaericus]|uniref:hypothetical protein n=1 Tax=Lysinibacillus sphaericus TaxID=1421 RepID=UPI003F7AE4C0
MRDKLKAINSGHIIKLLIFGIFGYLAINVITYWIDQPITHKGYIRDGHTVDFETEEILSEKELAKAAEQEQIDANAQVIQTLYYCLGVSEEIDNYDCLGNILSKDAKRSFETKEIDVGRNLYDSLIQGRILTGIEKEVLKEKYEKSLYNVWFKFLDGTKDNYEITVENGIITELKGRG